MKLDRVLTVSKYHDAPRLGIAELNGVPHIYESEFDERTEEYRDTYFLSPIDAELLALVIEDCSIFHRWRAAFLQGQVTPDSIPALPHERRRHEELKRAIGGRLKRDPMNRLEFKAKFKINPGTIAALLLGLFTAPTRVPFECRAIQRPELCNRTPGCGFREVYFKHPERYFDPRAEGCFPLSTTLPKRQRFISLPRT